MRTFLFFIFSPAIIFLVYDIFFYYLPIANNNYQYITYEYITFMVLCDFFGIITLFILYFKFYKFKRSNIVYKYNKLHISYYYLFNAIIFILIHYLILSVFNVIDYNQVISEYNIFYALSKRGTAWVFILINIFIFLMIFDLFKNEFNLHKVILFIIGLIMLSMTGGRSLIIIFMAFVIFIFIVVHNKKISLKILFFTLMLSIIIFFGNAVLRATSFDNYFKNNTSSKFDFDNAFILNDVINHYNNKGSENLLFFEDLYYSILPRKLFPNKPMSTAETRLVYPDVGETGTNYTFGIYANALINVGYLFILVVPIYLFFANYLYIKYVLFNKKKDLKTFIVIFFLFYSIQFIRGGIFNIRLLIIGISLIVAYFIFLLISRKSYKK